MIVWECAIRGGKDRFEEKELINAIQNWLCDSSPTTAGKVKILPPSSRP